MDRGGVAATVMHAFLRSRMQVGKHCSVSFRNNAASEM
jgi:hypothetical protein